MEVTLGTLLIICGIIMIAALLSTNISGLVVSTHGDTMLSDRLQKRLDSSGLVIPFPILFFRSLMQLRITFYPASKIS